MTYSRECIICQKTNLLKRLVKMLGGEAQKGNNLGISDTIFKVNGEILFGWNWQDKKRKKYENLSDYLCECIGASTEKNVCACSVDLAKYNHMTMAELFDKLE